MSTNFIDHILGPDDHASRPAAGDVPQGTLYSCTDHPIIYRSDGVSTWDEWRTSSGVDDILDLTTAEMDDSLVLAPDGAGGVEFRAEAGGGGGLTHAYAGYNTVGGSLETMTSARVYTKSITLASDGLIASIGAYLKHLSDNVYSAQMGVWANNGGVPGLLLSPMSPGGVTLHLNNASGGDFQSRWLHQPIGYWAVAGTYHIGVMVVTTAGSGMSIAYDTSGSDRYWTGGGWLSDGGFYAQTDSTRRYSIRASVLS